MNKISTLYTKDLNFSACISRANNFTFIELARKICKGWAMNSHINFVKPCGNNNLIHANKYLQNIAAYCYGERSTEYVTNYPKKLSVNLTYGYLGLYSSLRFSDQINNSDFLYIMDHPPVVSDLKGKVFRLHAADQDLTPQVFCSSFLSATHKNSISLSIKAMQRSDGMSISVPLSNKKTIDYLNAHQQVFVH